jgi:hypothetical protein
MKYSFRLLLIAIIIFFSNANATTHVVTNNNVLTNSPWNPTTPGSLAFAISEAHKNGNGDTIVFDYSMLGSPLIYTIPPSYSNYGIGGFTIDALRGLTPGVALTKLQVSQSPNNGGYTFKVDRPNTTFIGLEFVGHGGNGINFLSSNNTVDSCYIHDFNMNGIDIQNTGSNNTIKNSHIYNNNLTQPQSLPEHAGIYSRGSNTTIDSCYIYGNKSNGVLINTASASGAKITNSWLGRDNQGNELGNGWNGIFVWSANSVLIENNIIVNNGQTGNGPELISGVRFQAITSGTINNNYIGTDPLKSNSGNAFDGITLHTGVSNVNVTNNIVCNNGFLSSYGNGGGLALRTNSQNVVVSANFIGAHPDLSDGGNNDYGVSIEAGINNTIGGVNTSDGNVIGYSKNSPVIGTTRGCGLWITQDWAATPSTNNEVYNNNIINNSGAGIQIENTASNNIIGSSNQGNNIGGNLYGILVRTSSSVQNTLRYNSFSCNSLAGISLQTGGNNEYGNAVTLKDILVNTAEKRTDFISGLAPSAGATVDIYVADNICPLACDSSVSQGATMVASITASSTPNSNGLYFWEYDLVAGGNLVTKNNVVVLATENGTAGQVNTSEFSICANLCNVPTNSAINSADLDICAGENTILTANSQGKDAAEGYSYNWYLGSISLANKVSYEIDDSTLTVTQAGTYTVVISSQLDSASCSDTTTTATVVVNSLPTINITSPSNTMCDGDSVLINAGTNGANISIVWKPNGETTNTVYAKKDDTYEVVVTNTLTSCKDSTSTVISTSSLPVAALSAPFFCQGDITTVDAGISGMTYAWTPSGETTQSFTVTNELMHTVKITDPSTNCFVIDSILADQSPAPKPLVTLPIDSVMCLLQGQTITMMANVLSQTSGTLTWSNGTIDDTLSIATDTIEYIATYSDQYQCTGADTMKISNLCTPPDPELPNVVTVESPWVPFGDITPDQVLKSNFVVYNRWGLEIFSTEDALPTWKGYNERDLKCSAGVYFWVWEYTDVTETTYKYNGFMQLVN